MPQQPITFCLYIIYVKQVSKLHKGMELKV